MASRIYYSHEMEWIQVGPSYADWGNELFGRIFDNYYQRVLSIPNFDVEHDSTYSYARVSFISGGTNSGVCDVRITCEDVNDPQQIISRADYLSRVKTSNSILYSAPAWSAGNTYTIDITAAVREVTNRNGWTAGNRLNIFFETENGVSGVYRWPEGPSLAVSWTPIYVEPYQVRGIVGVGASASASVTAPAEVEAEAIVGLAVDISAAKIADVEATLTGIGLADEAIAEKISEQVAIDDAVALADGVEISRLNAAQTADAIAVSDAVAAFNLTEWFRANGHRAKKSYRLELAGAAIPFRDLSFSSEVGRAAIVRATVVDESAFPTIIANPAGRIRLVVTYTSPTSALSETLFDLPFSDCYFVQGGAVELVGVETTPASAKVISISNVASRHIANQKMRIALPEPNILARAGDRILAPGGIDFESGRISVTIGPSFDRMDISEA